MTAENWRERVAADLSLSVPEDDPQREQARRLAALRPPGNMPPPGPSGIDWAGNPEALGAELRRLREAAEPLVVRLPPEALDSPVPAHPWYVVVARRGGHLETRGPVQSSLENTQADADWHTENGAPAVACELREVPR